MEIVCRKKRFFEKIGWISLKSGAVVTVDGLTFLSYKRILEQKGWGVKRKDCI